MSRLRLAPGAEQRMSAWRLRRLAAAAAAVAELSPAESATLPAALPAALPALRRLGASLAQAAPDTAA